MVEDAVIYQSKSQSYSSEKVIELMSQEILTKICPNNLDYFQEFFE